MFCTALPNRKLLVGRDAALSWKAWVLDSVLLGCMNLLTKLSPCEPGFPSCDALCPCLPCVTAVIRYKHVDEALVKAEHTVITHTS